MKWVTQAPRNSRTHFHRSLERCKTRATAEPPSTFEHKTPGVEILSLKYEAVGNFQRLNHTVTQLIFLTNIVGAFS